MKLYVNPIVGRTGLSNMLFCWARAELCCKKTGAVMLAPQWTNWLRIGPWLRRERDKRYYVNVFSNEGYEQGIQRWAILQAFPHISELDWNAVEAGNKKCPKCSSLVIDFSGMEKFFDPILYEQDDIKNRLWAITSPTIRQAVASLCSEPFIGVHIRRGDFSLIGQAIDNAWYIRAIQRAKEEMSKRGCQDNVLIKVFSDSHPDCLLFLKEHFAHVEFLPQASALQDLWLLSKASVLVGTSRSTFSMWGAYLGQMTSIWSQCAAPPAITTDKKVLII